MAKGKSRKKTTKKRPATVSVDFGDAIANLKSRARATKSSKELNQNLMIVVASAVAVVLLIIAFFVEIVVVRTVDDQKQLDAADRDKLAQTSLRTANARVNDALKKIDEAKRQQTIGQANLDKAKNATGPARVEFALAAEKKDVTVKRLKQADATINTAREAFENAKITQENSSKILVGAKEKRDIVKKAWEDAITAKADATEVQKAYKKILDRVELVEKVAALTAKDLADKEAAAKTATAELERARKASSAAGEKYNVAEKRLDLANTNFNLLNQKFAKSAAEWAKAISQAEKKLDEPLAALKIATKESKDATEYKNTVDRGVTDIATTAVRSGLIAAAVGIFILLIQNFANSMRYYARLTEFYDSQADALLAANSHSELSITYLKELPPKGIDFGKTPTSLYEKALDMVGQFGKSSPKPE